jgi:hypothetical protein
MLRFTALPHGLRIRHGRSKLCVDCGPRVAAYAGDEGFRYLSRNFRIAP